MSSAALQTGSSFNLPIPVRTVFTDASLEDGEWYFRVVRGKESGNARSTYKLARTQGSLNSHSTFAVSAPRDERVILIDNATAVSYSQETGRYQVESVTETNQESVDVGGQSSDYSDSASYNGPAQRASQSGVEGGAGSTIRMGPELRGFSLAESSVPVGSSGSGRVCQLQQLQAPVVHVPVPRRRARWMSTL